MIPCEPQSAADYDDRTTAAVKSVLIEIGQILGSFKGKFAVIGGVVPWLLLNNEEMPHVGSIMAERTPAQWQQDAFGQVDAWLRALGLRS